MSAEQQFFNAWQVWWQATIQLQATWVGCVFAQYSLVPWESRAERAIQNVEARGLCHVITANFTR